MSFLNAVRPFIKAPKDKLTLTITGTADGGLSLVLAPSVSLPDPETSDPQLAALQAALAMPLVIRLPATATDLDAEVSRALQGMSAARAATVADLASYQEAQAEARNQAKLAAANKATTPAKAAAPGKAPSPSAPASAEAAAPSATPVQSTAPAATSLFD